MGEATIYVFLLLCAGLLFLIVMLPMRLFFYLTDKYRVEKLLKELPDSRFAVLKHIRLVQPEGGTCCCHYAIIGENGILFLYINTKRGWIEAHAGARRWRRNMNGQAYSFANPMRMFQRLTETAAKLLTVPKEQIDCRYVFTGAHKIKTEDVTPAVLLCDLPTSILESVIFQTEQADIPDVNYINRRMEWLRILQEEGDGRPLTDRK